ncbi:MAG: flavin reductase family protein [Bacillota bacterium]|nr:flavin reductase family protein [Bacillota bacterium]
MKKNLGAGAVAFPTPVYIVGTYGKDGEANAMNVAWGGLCSSEPPCVMIALRKGRYTYDNIKERRAFTVNIPSAQYAKEADFFGLISGKKTRKFDAVNLTVKKSETVDAPIIDDFPFVLECRYVKEMEIGEHIMVVGEILNMAVEENCLTSKNTPEINKIDPLIFDPAESTYHKVGNEVEKAFSAGLAYLQK